MDAEQGPCHLLGSQHGAAAFCQLAGCTGAQGIEGDHGWPMSQVKRDTAVLPQYRRPPMTLKVRPTTSHAAEGRRGFSVQLLSLKDTFASVGRLADQSNRPSSSSSEARPPPRRFILAELRVLHMQQPCLEG